MNPHIRYIEKPCGEFAVSQRIPNSSQNNAYLSKYSSKEKGALFHTQSYENPNIRNFSREGNSHQNFEYSNVNSKYSKGDAVAMGQKLQKCSSANDFFNSQPQEERQKHNRVEPLPQNRNVYPSQTLLTRNKSCQEPQYFPSQRIQSSPIQRQQQNFSRSSSQFSSSGKKNPFQNEIQMRKRNTEQNSCMNCQKLQEQNKKIVSMMKEQIEITRSEYVNKMKGIIKEQAQQIIMLQRHLVNNQKNIVEGQCEKQSLGIEENSFLDSFSKFSRTGGRSPSKKNGSLERSPSKLTLTKSNRSRSPHNPGNRQKISMVSKELSPHRQNSNSRKFSGDQSKRTVNLPEEMLKKIKGLQMELQSLHSRNTAGNQSPQLASKIRFLENRYLNTFGVKLHKIRQNMEGFIKDYDERIQTLYKQMKVISSKVGTASGHASSPSVISANRPQGQMGPNSTIDEQQLKKISNRLKKAFSEIEQLRDNMESIHNKQFKYDHYQLDELSVCMRQLQKEVYNLERGRNEIEGQILDYSAKVQDAIQMSKFSQQNVIQQPLQEQFMQREGTASYQMVNPMQTGEKSSMGYEFKLKNKSEAMGLRPPHKLYSENGLKNTGYTKKDSKNSNVSPYSKQSVFDGEQSAFSNFMDVTDNSADRSDYEPHSEVEEDEFFYPLNLQSDISVDQNSQEEPWPLGNNGHRIDCNMNFSNIQRFMEVIESRGNKPLAIEVDQTGYLKSAQNGMYIVDRNMDGFEMTSEELEWLCQQGAIYL